jgi:hypothetical protein
VWKQERGLLIIERTCLDTTLEDTTKDRREKTAKEMGVVADVDARGEKKKRIRTLLDAEKETQVQNLETSLSDLTWKFQRHFTTYVLDKLPLEHKFEVIDAEMKTIETLVAMVGKLEQLKSTDAKMKTIETLVARVDKLEQLKSTPDSKKSSCFVLGGNVTAGAEKENTIGVLVGDLEKLGGSGEEERVCF